MDEARCLNLSRIVTGEELFLIPSPSSLDFVCDECEVRMCPRAYKKEKNLVRPHFMVWPKYFHEEGCSAEGRHEIWKKGIKERLTKDQGYPLDYPNKFKLRKDDVADGNGVDVRSYDKPPLSSSGSGINSESRKTKKNYETTSFRSIVNQYFDFPYDRDLALDFEDIDGRTYDEIFYKIKSTYGDQEYRIQGEERKVYYGVLAWTRPEELEEKVKVFLTSGKWSEKQGKKVNERPYYIDIDFKGWPKQTKTKFMNDLNKQLDLVRGDKTTKAAIAFVGRQDNSDDYFRFYAEHRLLISVKIFSNDKG